MLIDGRTIDDDAILEAEICIVGGGFAGLTLCRKLVASGHNVLVLESGGRTADAARTKLISGKNVGAAPLALGGMRRQLAGGVNDWGANCALADKEDFEPAKCGQRDWPFGWEELFRFGDEALLLLGVQDETDRKTLLNATDHVALPNGQSVATKPFLKADENLGERLSALVSHSDFPGRVVSHSTVVRFDLNSSGQSVDQVKVSTDGKRFSVRAKTVVLTSGLENAAIMLRGLAREHAAVSNRWPAMGRGLHAHLLTLHSVVQPVQEWSGFRHCALPSSLERGKDATLRFGGLALSAGPDAPALNGLMFFAQPEVSAITSKRAIRVAHKHLGLRRRLFGRYRPLLVRHYLEQPARWEAKVTLGPPSGPMGLATPQYQWGLGAEEWDTIIGNSRRLGAFCERHKLGYVLGVDRPADTSDPYLARNAHPEGGTLMGDDPKLSVVDPDLKVHGMANLYVCGGSVIPRGGTSMVTGVIAQLALRLASHLDSLGDGH